MTNPNIEQLTAAQKANAEVMVALVHTAFNGVEKIAELNLAAARDFLNSSVNGTQTLLDAKDVQEAAKLQSTLAQPNLEKVTAYYRNLYELITATQKEVTDLMEQHYNQLSQKATSAIEKTSASAPVGGDVVAAAMKSMLSASTQAFDHFTKMAKQMADIADANVAVASNATAKAVGAASKAAAKK